MTPFGEAALLVELDSNARVHALAQAIDAASLPAIENLVPGVSSLLVEFDPLALDAETLSAAIAGLVSSGLDEAPTSARVRSVPVVYGGEHGPDLDDVSARLGLLPTEVVARHTDAEHSVLLIGFAPGFPYLGGLPSELALPRRTTPRERVPGGSVAIAGRQTGIYPRVSPGGWHLLGRTPIVLFDPAREPPAYFAPGDRVRFVRIQASEWDACAGPPSDW